MTEAASGTPAPPMADDHDEESRSEEAGNDDLQSGEEQESDPDAVERLLRDKEDQEALEGLSSMFDQITTPRNAEETIRANRAGKRTSEVPPPTTKKPGTTLDGYAPAGPAAEGRPRYVHFAEYMSEAETRRQQAAELKAFIMEKVEGAETGRDAEYVREIARSLSTIADPSTMSDSVREGVLYPPGDLAVDPHTGRLASGRRRIESNSALIREMASGDTGEPVSAIDARWWPEYGNRGELEAKIGAIVSSLDATVAAMSTLPVFHPHVPSAYGTARSLLMLFQSLQITLRNRGLGAMSFDQMMFNDENLATPQPEEWPDMICSVPGTGNSGHEVGVDQQYGRSSFSRGSPIARRILDGATTAADATIR